MSDMGLSEGVKSLVDICSTVHPDAVEEALQPFLGVSKRNAVEASGAGKAIQEMGAKVNQAPSWMKFVMLSMAASIMKDDSLKKALADAESSPDKFASFYTSMSALAMLSMMVGYNMGLSEAAKVTKKD